VVIAMDHLSLFKMVKTSCWSAVEQSYLHILVRLASSMLRDRRGSLTAEVAIVAGVCVIVIVMMANICLFLIRAVQFDGIAGEVARTCAYADAPWSAQEGIEYAMGLSGSSGGFRVTGTESGGGVCQSKTISFELQYQPFVSRIGIGNVSLETPVLRRSKTFAVPSIGYGSEGDR